MKLNELNELNLQIKIPPAIIFLVIGLIPLPGLMFFLCFEVLKKYGNNSNYDWAVVWCMLMPFLTCLLTGMLITN